VTATPPTIELAEVFTRLEDVSVCYFLTPIHRIHLLVYMGKPFGVLPHVGRFLEWDECNNTFDIAHHHLFKMVHILPPDNHEEVQS
jgi:hypothetical protein